MGGDKIGHLNFHLHMPHLKFNGGGSGRREARGIPKGCFAITVGQGAEQQRFVVPVMYVNHPLFVDLLKEAEEEYGFDHDGPINIPCHVDEFRQVRCMIDKDTTSSPSRAHHRHEDHHHHLFMCFGA